MDDYANTNCTTLTNWGNSNIGTNSTKFSNAAISMNDYGGPGMPKIVVVGGLDHHVYYNSNDTVNATALQNAINFACTTGINNHSISDAGVTVFPVPSTGSSLINCIIENRTTVSIELFDIRGIKVKTILENSFRMPGEFNIEINTSSLSDGIYFLKVKRGGKTDFIKLIVSN
ncbi:MAG: T9SS type A sorting domain-containing protein [Bacteroidia bacterium]|nr:T9SS type A sorting domain-containing protein [Bacteroidia bacterium]